MILIFIVVFIWVAGFGFYTTRDIIKQLRYLRSQEITNRSQNNNCDNEPKHYPMGLIHNTKYSINNKSNSKTPSNKYGLIPIFLRYHCKRIIGWLNNHVNRNRGEP